jgi:DNA invertase Pin-like site-specific DNA recombinase
MTRRSLRCAIYTRKSSDEGLDQSFNSLDAQREAGEAYVKSQAHEGWRIIPKRYDDGGCSGGTMERPALQRLLADVDADLIDVVVVYKIDRLTRSLPDFARIVERFDARDVSFVSVTQAFNTTSSMGRLTLNVLLSFAQFEREVTGERIRDKIAASKAKGLWMGGNPPLGYDLPAPGTRTLKVNRSEAITVRKIFAGYLNLGSVHALQRELAEQGIVSKHRVTASGRAIGGLPFSRGALFHLLRNPIYRGRIAHKSEVHDGEHEAIIEQDLYDAVQQQLDRNTRRHRSAAAGRTVKAPLTGKLFDAAGEPMSPAFSRGSSGRLYRYYVSASLQQGRAARADNTIRRIPAVSIEKLLGELIARWLPKAGKTLEILQSIRLRDDGLLIDMPGNLTADLTAGLSDGETIIHSSRKACRIEVAIALPLRGGKRLIITGHRTSRPDRTLIAGLRRAHALVQRDRGLPILTTAPASRYERELLRLAFLAPDLQRDILAGHQPPTLTLEKLRQMDIPVCWRQQRRVLGWC